MCYIHNPAGFKDDNSEENLLMKIVTYSILCLMILTSAIWLNTSVGEAHSGGLDAQGCHGGSKPYHCHRSASEMVPSTSGGNRLKCSAGSRSRDCVSNPLPKTRFDNKIYQMIGGGTRQSVNPNFTTYLYRDRDLVGRDYDQVGIRNISFEDCVAVCVARWDCTGLSYINSANWCWPKKMSHGKNVFNPGITSVFFADK